MGGRGKLKAQPAGNQLTFENPCSSLKCCCGSLHIFKRGFVPHVLLSGLVLLWLKHFAMLIRKNTALWVLPAQHRSAPRTPALHLKCRLWLGQCSPNSTWGWPGTRELAAGWLSRAGSKHQLVLKLPFFGAECTIWISLEGSVSPGPLAP